MLDGWMGRRAGGRWAAATCGLAVPRQNGKNAVIEVREFYGAAILGERIIHTAHQVKTAREAFVRVAGFFEDESHPEVTALVREVRRANGQEAVTLTNGGQIRFIARSGPSGRGMTADVLILDEAQDLSDDELAALMPMISASPLGNPQVILTGTPPDPARPGHGDVFRRIRDDGESRRDARLAWTDYGVPDGPLPDIEDHELLLATNPSMAPGLISPEEADRERSLMAPETYARERLGWWGDPSTAAGVAFGAGRWEARNLNGDPRVPPAAIGLAVSWDRLSASIGVAGLAGDDVVVGSFDRRDGVGWLVAEAARIQAAHGCAVGVDEKGPVSDLIPALEAAGVRLTLLSTSEYADACASLFTGVVEGGVVHFGTDALDAAVAVAGKRNIGDRWAWARRQSTGDISMLEAVTVAAWLAAHPPPVPNAW